jgi:hypothetical protein
MSENYPHRLVQIGIKLLEPFTSCMKQHKMQCVKCNHIWTATPIAKTQTFKKYGVNGCPECKKIRTNETHDETRKKCIKRIEDKGFTIISPYDGIQLTTIQIKVRNNNCGHEFESAPGNLLHRDVVCPICNTELKQKTLRERNKARHLKYLETATDWQKYKTNVTRATTATYRKYKKIINPNNYSRRRCGQESGYQLDHIISVRTCYENNIPFEICGCLENLQMLSWEENLQKKNRIDCDFIPPIMQRYIDNTCHSVACIKALTTLLKNHNIEYEVDSDIIFPRRVHLWIPSCRVAIRIFDVFNDVEQRSISNNIMINTLKYAKTKEITLIQIFTDEWINNPDLVVNKLAHICKINQNFPKIYARCCKINSNVPNKDKNAFLLKNHIQGSDKSQITIAAYHPDDNTRIVAVMTFCKPRNIMGRTHTQENAWELSRFATDISLLIPGIASKLLNTFIIEHKNDVIFSYADARWSEGNLYNQLGFKKLTHNKPSYSYVVNGKRMHRWGFRKDAIRDKYPEIYDNQKTEYQMMCEVGIDRVWDAGTILFAIDNRKLDTDGIPINP